MNNQTLNKNLKFKYPFKFLYREFICVANFFDQACTIFPI